MRKRKTRICKSEMGLHYPQYKFMGFWFSIKGYEYGIWATHFLQLENAEKAIDKFIEDGYRQYSIIEYP